jgi:hypothetical protein
MPRVFADLELREVLSELGQAQARGWLCDNTFALERAQF